MNVRLQQLSPHGQLWLGIAEKIQGQREFRGWRFFFFFCSCQNVKGAWRCIVIYLLHHCTDEALPALVMAVKYMLVLIALAFLNKCANWPFLSETDNKDRSLYFLSSDLWPWHSLNNFISCVCGLASNLITRRRVKESVREIRQTLNREIKSKICCQTSKSKGKVKCSRLVFFWIKK